MTEGDDGAAAHGSAPAYAVREAGRVEVLGCPVDRLTLDQTVARLADLLSRKCFVSHSCVNAAKLVRMRKDLALRRAVAGSDVVSADGMPVVWLSRLLGDALPERVAGCDLMPALVRLASERGHPVFFLGARPEVVADLVARYGRLYPALKVAGHRDGYFRPEDSAQVAAEVRASGARILFLALPTPRKELFVSSFAEQLGPVLAVGVGGTFDVEAGRVRRAPRWMQTCGLEWVWRLHQEPRKMWKRYLVTNTMFLWLAALAVGRRLLGRRSPRGRGGETGG